MVKWGRCSRFEKGGLQKRSRASLTKVSGDSEGMAIPMP